MKKILLFISIIFLTGCSANYNLSLDDTTANEKIDIKISNNISNSNLNKIEELFSSPIPLLTNFTSIEEKFYKIDASQSNFYKIEGEYVLNQLAYSNLLNECFDNFQIEDNDELTAINIKGNFYCLNDFKEIKVNITTENYVSTNNADDINNRTYTWVIKESNKETVDIEFITYKNTKQITNIDVKGNDISGYLLLGFIILVAVVTFATIRVIYKKIDER